MTRLALTVPGAVRDGGHRIGLPAKTLSGLTELARPWNGEVTFVTESITEPAPPDPADWVEVERSSLPFTVEATADRAAVISSLQPDLTLVTLTQGELSFIESLETPYVVLTEFDAEGRKSVQTAVAPNGRVSPRVRFGTQRRERRMSRIVSHAVGMQANGPIPYRAYESHTPNPLLFFDSRISRPIIDGTAPSDRRERSAVTFAFSGRWIRAKGFDDAIAAFIDAYDRSARPLGLQLFGSGEGVVPEHPGIEVLGNVDYDHTWIPHFRDHVDYLLIPHRQPDPSCTYLEGAGLGVPFLSYDNEHAAWLASQGLGRVAPLGDRTALTELVLAAAADPGLREPMSRRGREFMATHYFESEFSSRRDHLAACADLGMRRQAAGNRP